MKRLRETLTGLSKLTSRFEELVSAATAGNRLAGAGRVHSSALEGLDGFGSNPGNLRLLAHCPGNLPKGAPLVVALHGCTQSAADYDHGSGWSALADACGFAVVFPEQQRVNNPNNCFNWFLPSHTTRGAGEALSIAQMTEYTIALYGSDRRRVYIAGLSAGGAMTAAMLAAYPDVFAGGAIIAGLPHGAAANVQQALQTMAAATRRTPKHWGDLVRASSPHSGPWPKISIWHGTADTIVTPQNMEELLKQWGDVHGVSVAPDAEHRVKRTMRRVWSNSAGDEVIEAISVEGMPHGVPIGTVGRHEIGNAGAYHFDVGISSTHQIASFWSIADEMPEEHSPRETVGASGQPPLASALREIPLEDALAGVAANPQPITAGIDPRIHITAALKAAGLLDQPRRGGSSLDPRTVIQNALRSAGLLKD